MLLVHNYVLLKMSTWYSKHVEESNNILRINNIQWITLVIIVWYYQTIVCELQNMFYQCLYLPKIYVVCEDCNFFCIWKTTWMNCLKISKTSHVFYPPIQTVKRKVLAVASFWNYTKYTFCLTGSKFLSFAIIYRFPYL